jgi:hypothetical protein
MGPFSTELGCPRHFRLSPKSGSTPDIAALRIRGNYRRIRRSKERRYSITSSAIPHVRQSGNLESAEEADEQHSRNIAAMKTPPEIGRRFNSKSA